VAHGRQRSNEDAGAFWNLRWRRYKGKVRKKLIDAGGLAKKTASTIA
jgi:hypothetical protein